MDKLKMHSVNKVNENIEKIGALFPNALTELIRGYNPDGSPIVEAAIDYDILRQELSNVIVDGPEERYQFTWPDKKKSILLANAPIAKTLRPCREESVNFDTTENLYIEGDNLDALKLLQETYLGKVKMIYIDPPYNTGNDFVYEDDFAQSADQYLAHSGQFDEESNRLVQNTESNGRFHTDWLNMIYPRLKLAKDLLTDDGVMFISIDDNEIDNLKKICTEVFGADGFLANFVWKRRTSSAMDQSNASTDHEYVLAYKKLKFCALNGTTKDYKGYSNPDNDLRGLWTTGDLTVGMNADMRPNQFYDLIDPNTGKIYKPNYNRVWAYIPESMEKLIAENRVVFPEDTSKRPMRKRFANELKIPVNPFSTWMNAVGLNMEGTRSINSLFDNKSLFNYAKPVSLVSSLIVQTTGANDIVMDFFSGSATTAHAVMQLNVEDGGKRKFIMVQLPETTDENSEAYKAGYQNICEIGKERIRRAGQKIVSEIEQAQSQLKLGEDRKIPDVGFRVLKVDSTNLQDVYYNPSQYKQEQLGLFADNLKPDRFPEDLLFQVMLDLGVLLSSKIEETTIGGKKVFNVADGYLLACFDTDVTSEVVTAIAQQHPYYAVFRDSGIASDSVATNFEQIFATYSPTTVRKVL